MTLVFPPSYARTPKGMTVADDELFVLEGGDPVLVCGGGERVCRVVVV